MVWIGRDLKDHVAPTPLPRAVTSSTRPGCSDTKLLTLKMKKHTRL